MLKCNLNFQYSNVNIVKRSKTLLLLGKERGKSMELEEVRLVALHSLLAMLGEFYYCSTIGSVRFKEVKQPLSDSSYYDRIAFIRQSSTEEI